jgi:hypothetical protein
MFLHGMRRAIEGLFKVGLHIAVIRTFELFHETDPSRSKVHVHFGGSTHLGRGIRIAAKSSTLVRREHLPKRISQIGVRFTDGCESLATLQLNTPAAGVPTLSLTPHGPKMDRAVLRFMYFTQTFDPR